MIANLEQQRARRQSLLAACAGDPERWTSTEPDEEAKALCRACVQRAWCAREACETPNAQGLWAGVVIPESGRARAFARRKLRSLADLGSDPLQRYGSAS